MAPLRFEGLISSWEMSELKQREDREESPGADGSHLLLGVSELKQADLFASAAEHLGLISCWGMSELKHQTIRHRLLAYLSHHPLG